LKILGIEVKDAFRDGDRILRKKSKHSERARRPDKHPLLKIRIKSIRQLAWLYLLFKENKIRPSSIDFTILQDVVAKKLGIAKRTAYSYALALVLLS